MHTRSECHADNTATSFKSLAITKDAGIDERRALEREIEEIQAYVKIESKKEETEIGRVSEKERVSERNR